MAALLGLAAALGYGGADFLGGLLSRRARVLPVVFWSQAASLVVLLTAMVVVRPGGASPGALAWGGAAGAAAAVALVVYFRGLTRARMGVVASITAVVAALLPVLVGLGLGERPSAVALAGVALAIGAVALVSVASSLAATPGMVAPPGGAQIVRETPFAPGVIDAVVAGALFALFFVGMDQTGDGNVLWPLLAANVASLVVLGAATTATRRSWRPSGAPWLGLVGAGLLGTGASLAFLLAVRVGLLSLVSVLAALSPAVTVALARVVVGERLTRGQLGGLVAAVAGVAMITAG